MFLKKLYYQWRAMFWIVIIFILGQAFFMFKGIQNIPFFLYHMFSTKHVKQPAYKVLLIKIDSNYFDHTVLSNREYEMIIGSAERYASLKNLENDPINKLIESRVASYGEKIHRWFIIQLSNDTKRLDAFPAWWAKYFSKVSGIPGKQVSLVSRRVQYAPGLIAGAGDSILFTINLPDAK